MENNKIVYGSTSDFLKYIRSRTKEKEKNIRPRYNFESNIQETSDTDNMQSFE
jgi:hypothetical protein